MPLTSKTTCPSTVHPFSGGAFSAALAVALLLSACTGRGAESGADSGNGGPTPESVDAAHQGEETIAWFEGTVEEAFETAAAEGRPVFLYWGAVWCPPCHYLRSKVFTLPEVAERLDQTVAVYLDGDTERAQLLGETYQTEGYPTVIVFSPDGREISRIDTLLPAEQWVEALQNALDAGRPAGEVLAAVEAAGPAEIPVEDLHLLASASWSQDPSLDLPAERLLPVLWRLASETPESLPSARARFLGLWLAAIAGEEEQEVPAAHRDEARERVLALLENPERRRENLLLVYYYAREVVPLLAPDEGELRTSLISAWQEAARALTEDPSLGRNDRLTAYGLLLDLERLASGSEEVPEDLKAEVVAAIEATRAAIEGPSERQAVLSTITALYRDIGRDEDASRVLEELEGETTAPWYWISYRAAIEADADRPDAAVALWRQAWQTAEGRYSRFRWAVTYLTRRMALLPEDAETIRTDLDAILDELLEAPDPFSGGFWSRLERLGGATEEWAEEYDGNEILDGFRGRIADACSALPEDDGATARERCQSFLSDG